MLPPVCTKENNYAGCWHADAADAAGDVAHACVELLADFKALAARGLANMSTPYFTCRCPPCYTSGADGKSCTPACDASKCDKATGTCAGSGTTHDVKPPPGGGSAPPSTSTSSGGMSGWGVALLVLLTAAGTGGAFVLANKYLLTQVSTGPGRTCSHACLHACTCSWGGGLLSSRECGIRCTHMLLPAPAQHQHNTCHYLVDSGCLLLQRLHACCIYMCACRLQRMSGEIRDIMAQYMPLDERMRARGGGGGGPAGGAARGGTRGDRAGLMSAHGELTTVPAGCSGVPGMTACMPPADEVTADH